jgi:hypothetical protein
MSKSEIQRIYDNLATIRSNASEVSSEVEDLNNSWNVDNIVSTVNGLENEMWSVLEELESLKDSIDEDTIETREHRESHQYLSIGVRETLRLLATAVERVTTLLDDSLAKSDFHFENTSHKDDDTKRNSLSDFRWLLIDFLGGSQESFEKNLLNKRLDYTYREREQKEDPGSIQTSNDSLPVIE